MLKFQVTEDSSAAVVTSDVNPWLQLFRLPNLFTAPGDAVVGFMLASSGAGLMLHVGALVGLAELFFYAAGLALNDLVDEEEDGYDRPHRPIPSGRIKSSSVTVAASLLFCSGLAVCLFLGWGTFWMGVCLVAAIFSYNLGSKNLAVLGPLNMGACRGLSVFLGMSAAAGSSFNTLVLLATSLITIYVYAVAQLARHETGQMHSTIDAWVPVATLTVGCAVLSWVIPPLELMEKIGFLLAAAAACIITLRGAIRLTDLSPSEDVATEFRRRAEISESVPWAVGWFISGLIILQAMFFFVSGRSSSMVLGCAWLLLWPINRWLVRKYYAS